MPRCSPESVSELSRPRLSIYHRVGTGQHPGVMIVTYCFWNTIGKFLANLILFLAQRHNPLDFKTPILTQWAFLRVMLPIFLLASGRPR